MTDDKHGCAVCGEAFDISEGTLSDNIGGFQDFICNPCEELEEVINAIKASIDATDPQEKEIIASLYKAIELIGG